MSKLATTKKLNYVGGLYDAYQRRQIPQAIYTYESQSVPCNVAWECTITITLPVGQGGKKTFSAVAGSKKEAKQLAAANACEALGVTDVKPCWTYALFCRKSPNRCTNGEAFFYCLSLGPSL